MKIESIRYLVVHHSVTPNTTRASTIRRYHVTPKPVGNGWSDVGYHWLIESDGTIRTGRPRHVAGAHCPPHNRRSWGVCVIGDNTKPGREWTLAQREALCRLVDAVRLIRPEIEVVGHFEVGSTKTVCPGLDSETLHSIIEGEF